MNMKVLNKTLTAIIILFIITPMVSMLIWSFFSSWPQDSLLPQNFSLRGFLYFFKSKDWIIAAKSVGFSLLAAFFSLVLSIMISRVLIVSNFKHKVKLESVFYLPMLLPVVSICMGSHKLFLSLFSGMCGIMVFVLHVYFSLPYAFKMVYSYYILWGVEQEQVARGLGANKYQAFYLVNIPVYLKGYISSFIMAFIISYSQYFINFFIGDSNFVNFSMIMTPYISGSNRNISSLYTLMYILCGIIVMIFCSFIEKIYKNNIERNEEI